MDKDASACIVVVEDEPDILNMLRDVLEMDGYDAVGFNHPFLVRDLTTAADLFLLDVMLPEQSGIEVALMLRSSGYRETPMIGMSASRLMLDLAAASGLFQEVLPKPFELDTLLALIRRQLDASMARSG